jgi:hypothetical protein
VPEPDNNKVIVYEEFLSLAYAYLCIWPWLIFYYTFKHNCISCRLVLSHNCQKKNWAVGSFRGVPSRNVFVKWYELHYQLKIVETPEGD